MNGNECVKAQKYTEAVECYNKSLKIKRDEPFTYANRAMAFLKMKEFKKAIDDSNMALRLKPDYLKAHHR